MNRITTYLFIFPTFLIFSLASKGNETDVIMTETKHVYVHLWVSVCRFLPLLQRHCTFTGWEKIRGQVDDCRPISERRTLPVDNTDSASENHCGRAKLWMAEGTKSVKCRGVGVFVKLNFHALYSFCLSAGDWNIFWCRGIARFDFYIKNQKMYYIKTLSHVLQNLLIAHTILI